MKNVLILFLLLFITSGRGNAYAYANANAQEGETSCTAGEVTKEVQQVESTAAVHDYLFTTHTSLRDENPHFISIDDEDENEDFIKKHISQSRYFFAFCYAFILEKYSTQTAARIPSGAQLSYTSTNKYIVQRALRI